jgi:hypothetical protein
LKEMINKERICTGADAIFFIAFSDIDARA